MKRFVNDPERYVREMLDGLVKAHPRALAQGDDPFASSAPMRRSRAR